MATPLKDRSPVTIRLFQQYLRFLFWRRFDKVMISRTGLPDVPREGPLIVYCNHPSWWDPALFMLLASRLFPGRLGFGPMDHQALARYGLFRRLGVFGIEPDTRSGAAEFLKTCMHAFENPRAMLFITAEGHFVDSRRRPIRLRTGIAHLARKLPGVVLLPLAFEYSFWNESRPVALLRFGKPLFGDKAVSTAIWADRLEHGLAENLDMLTAESVTRDMRKFVMAYKGAEGGDRLYDLVRRLGALGSGRAFSPRHEVDPK